MDAAAAAAELAQHPDYRVLRRFVPRADSHPSPAFKEHLKCGLYLDAETTGLNTETDRIIQFAMTPFWYDETEVVLKVGAGASWYEDPGVPVPEEITALTGITDDDVKGQIIPDTDVETAIAEAVVIIAHNADFDRKMTERRWPSLAKKAWACSYRDVQWRETFGAACSKLPHLLADTCGVFYDAHRALDDCCAGVHLLATAKVGERTALSYLLESARSPTYRVSAGASMPSAFNALLKLRGYRWHNGETGRPKEWHKECSTAVRGDEVKWLLSQGVRPVITRFNAFDRYSIRAA